MSTGRRILDFKKYACQHGRGMRRKPACRLFLSPIVLVVTNCYMPIPMDRIHKSQSACVLAQPNQTNRTWWQRTRKLAKAKLCRGSSATEKNPAHWNTWNSTFIAMRFTKHVGLSSRYFRSWGKRAGGVSHVNVIKNECVFICVCLCWTGWLQIVLGANSINLEINNHNYAWPNWHFLPFVSISSLFFWKFIAIRVIVLFSHFPIFFQDISQLTICLLLLMNVTAFLSRR